MKTTPSSRRRTTHVRRCLLVAWTIGSMLSATTHSLANPLGPMVIDGSAAVHAAGQTLTITQATDRAIINWQGFSIGQGELTQFIQPGAQSAVLNRVTGGNPSALLGTLQANGQVFLINPNGILVGPGAQINVGALTASTLDIDNAQFMQGGDLHFRGDSQAGVVNRGSINALEGDIYLIGARVENHGTLRATHGTIGLAAGQEVRLVDSAHPRLVVRPSDASLGSTGIHNTGTIEALQAELAAAHGNVYALAINNEGVVRANGSLVKNGRVYLTAPGGNIANTGSLVAKSGTNGGTVNVDSGPGGETKIGGTIDAAGDAHDATSRGGQVHLLGDRVELAAATITSNLAAANVVVATDGAGTGNGDVTIGAPMFYTSANDFTILAHSDIRADASVQNSGSGALNLIAGWDGITEAPGPSGIVSPAPFDFTSFLKDPTTYGHSGGSLWIGDGTQQTGIAVGSRLGPTNVAAASFSLRASDTTRDGFAQLGHGDASGYATGTRAGNIRVIAGGDVTLAGVPNLANSRIGHATAMPGGISGDLVLAIDQIDQIDQIDPMADNGGRLSMNRYSAIDMGGQPNEVRIFGTRRLGNLLEDGAMINGMVVDSSLPPGTLGGDRWNPNVDFLSWDHEQWGQSEGQYTLAAPGPFATPFTFYYLNLVDALPGARELLTAFETPYDRFGRTADFAATLLGMFPNGPYRILYGDPPDRPADEMAGDSRP